MNENPNPNETENLKEEPEMIVNDYGETKDSAVVVEEADRTVFLTENETIVIEKDPMIAVVPKNRPRKVYSGMWGTAEITTFGLSLLAILAVIILYFFFVLPRQKELDDNRAKRDKLEQELISANKKYGDITSTETQVAKLIRSVDDFETLRLKPASISQAALYQQINGLISAYGLVNTTGPDYTRLEINTRSNNGQEAAKESGRAKYQSLFPGDYVTVTVEGTYQNLRRFIREIETSNQFIVISAIELEGAEKEQKDNPNQIAAQQQIDTRSVEIQNQPNPVQQTQQPKSNRGKTRGELVALRLEMAAYYRRPNFQPVTVDKTEEQR